MRHILRVLTPRTDSALTLLVPLLSLGFSLTALYFVYLERSQTHFEVDASRLDGDALEVTFRRAQDAVESAQLVLSFLEGASVLAGIILIGAGVLGLTSIQDLRNDTEAMKDEVFKRLEEAEKQLIDRVDRAEHELLSRAEQLAQLEAQLEETIARTQDRIDTQIQAATRHAESSFEALSHHIMAQRLARENNIDAAIKSCRDAHELDPDNIPNNYLLGTLLIRKDELDEAVERLTEAYNQARRDGEMSSIPAQAALGLATRKKGDKLSNMMERNRFYNLAENYLLDATHHDPHLLNDNRESYFGVLGSLYRRQGRERDAIAAFIQAAEITPRRSYPEINLAMLYLEQGNKDRSEIHRQRAESKARSRLDDTPEDYWALHDVAMAVLLNGRVEEALEIFGRALELTP
ncbi:MAG TPA: tetratricopeptide repeat protein, partial [Aggregatilineales bacterium]|nr:tetratricopeptide repeat protein [Aggregatilineales bacterium]